MKLAEFLEKTGWTKAQLARHLGISSPAVSLWEEIPEKWFQFCAVILSNLDVNPIEPPKYVRKCHPKDLPDDEMKLIIRNRAAVSDWDICQERGWRVHDYTAC